MAKFTVTLNFEHDEEEYEIEAKNVSFALQKALSLSCMEREDFPTSFVIVGVLNL